jgi:hypothetical protein
VQVSFLMNNLTVDNMGSKSKDLGGVIIPKFIEWFANYLVVKRAAQVQQMLQLFLCHIPGYIMRCMVWSWAACAVYMRTCSRAIADVGSEFWAMSYVSAVAACAWCIDLVLLLTAGAQPPQDVRGAAGCACTQGPLQERSQHHILLLQVRHRQLWCK